MIEINLLPGATKKGKGRGTSLSLGSAFSGFTAKVKDPYLLSALASVGAAAAVIAVLYVAQQTKARELAGREEKAVADSTRYATVLAARRSAEARRDSLLRQLELIRSIDDDRFIWPHIMDEVSRALPPYTWLKSMAVLAPVTPPATPAPAPTPPPASGSAKGNTTPNANATASATPGEQKMDPMPSKEPVRFRLVGHTVDIQALTRFMKLLESSPFIQNVQLARSDLAMVDNREVTEFQLEAEYERPDKAAITTVPVALSAR
jgi:Tfp pilus assembly protein PilN